MNLKQHGVPSGLLAAALFAWSAPAAAQLNADDPPTILERIDRKLQKNPEMGKLFKSAPPQMEDASWMAGEWTVVQKRFATPLSPEKVSKGTRHAAVELGGRWIVSRDTYEDGHEGRGYLGYLAYKANWVYQFFTSDGLVTTTPLVSQNPWVNGRVSLDGTLWWAGENAQVSLRITRLGPDSFLETWEESLAGGRVKRPVVEHSLTRVKK